MSIRRCALHFLAVFSTMTLAAVGGADAPPNSQLTARESHVLEKICAQCHARPGIGAPLVGDETEWEARRAGGLERLLRNTIDGFRGMPPLGTCSFCSEDELRRLVLLISGMPSGIDP